MVECKLISICFDYSFSGSCRHQHRRSAGLSSVLHLAFNADNRLYFLNSDDIFCMLSVSASPLGPVPTYSREKCMNMPARAPCVFDNRRRSGRTEAENCSYIWVPQINVDGSSPRMPLREISPPDSDDQS